jgi:hypothetical protein
MMQSPIIAIKWNLARNLKAVLLETVSKYELILVVAYQGIS